MLRHKRAQSYWNHVAPAVQSCSICNNPNCSYPVLVLAVRCIDENCSYALVVLLGTPDPAVLAVRCMDE